MIEESAKMVLSMNFGVDRMKGDGYMVYVEIEIILNEQPGLTLFEYQRQCWHLILLIADTKDFNYLKQSFRHL